MDKLCPLELRTLLERYQLEGNREGKDRKGRKGKWKSMEGRDRIPLNEILDNHRTGGQFSTRFFK